MPSPQDPASGLATRSKKGARDRTPPRAQSGGRGRSGRGRGEAEPSPSKGLGTAERGLLIAGGLWLLVCAGLALLAPEQIGLFSALLPLLLLGVAFLQAGQLRRLRQEAADMRQLLAAQGDEALPAHRPRDPSPLEGTGGAAAAALAADAALGPMQPPFAPSQAQNSAAGATPVFHRAALAAAPSFHTSRDGGDGRASDGGEPLLPLDQPTPPPPLPVADFLQALNFPQTAEDTDGFRALRRALKHPEAAVLIQAAQDVLTLLSQQGLYVDDLAPDQPRPELWRRFGTGERGGIVAGLGGVRDPQALDLAAAQMRNDPVFRDAAHHFLRRFDKMLSARSETLSDSDLVTLSDTRSARAFMLLGRVAGVFE